ncbi:hypothetical protein KTD31_01290 [Burkholderia multivorans]|uniref:hypothetical protein n=1 Tax=Burkholderia multivorans TaxID=87883 RepID=UPI001C217D96|nr:hypothetical protein [Burkholderia multivorans]MBU9200036.1 hypothetical protein [Burkholderia multivorans]MDN8078845.1 hypothetical protein [Burkholderia multivorans]
MHQRTGRLARSVCTMIALAALSACSGFTTHAPSELTRSLPAGTLSTTELQALDSHGKLPALDWSTDLKGPDKDGNGIRDDVDAIIRAGDTGPAWPVKFKNAAQRAAVNQLAKAYQTVATVDVRDSKAVEAAKQKLTSALECAQSRFEINDMSMMDGSLEVYTFNTAARQQSKAAFWNAVGSSLKVMSNDGACR